MDSIIGRPVTRIDARDKVTGQGLYSADLKIKDALWVKLVRSPIAHGVIKKIDASKLRDQEGVYCLTAGDLKENSFGNIIKDQPVLAQDRIRFVGEPVAQAMGVPIPHQFLLALPYL